MDPMLLISIWLMRIGDADELVFCNIAGSNNLRIVHYELWNRKALSSLMHERLTMIGMVERKVKVLTGNSPKRGRVQLLRVLGVKDAYIMH